jgi:diacylglycerol kinase
MIKTLKSFNYAVKGLISTWKEEPNFRIEVIVAVLVLFCMFYFSFTLAEIAFCILVITMVLTAEIVNTIIEDVCNKIEPNHDPFIEKIKDMSSAFVLLSTLGSLAIGIIVFYNHFFLV